MMSAMSDLASRLGFSDTSGRDWLKYAAVGTAAVVGALTLKRFVCAKKRKLNVPNYEKDVIYLCSFPRPTDFVIQLSPFALKLETWLRMTNQKYEYVDTRTPSSNGQFPYVEVNGVEIADSNIIIKELGKRLKLDPDTTLTPEQRGTSQAFKHLFEFSLSCCYALYRYVDNTAEYMQIMRKMFPQFKWFFFMPFLQYQIRRQVRTRAYHHGYGRLSREQVYDIGCEDIRAISNYLGGKQFLMGDKPTSVDCWAFGHLCQLVYCPLAEDLLRDYIDTQAHNVKQYVQRMQEKFYPDWDKLIKAAADGRSLAKA